MRIETVDFKTGWMSVEIYLKKRDIAALIETLNKLQNQEAGQHFHISNSDLNGGGGIVDIEIIKDDENGKDTFQGPSGFATDRHHQH